MIDPAAQSAVYLLCVITSASCALLLARNYLRTKVRLLLWSALSFAFMALNNLIVFVDIVLLPQVTGFTPFRLGASLAAVSILLYGFVWEGD